MNKESGQAAILIIFVIGMVSLLIGMTLTKTGFSESFMGRRTFNSTYAFYVANSGIEDAFHKIQSSNFGNPGPDQYTLTVGDGVASVTVSGTSNERVIESVGKYKNIVRIIRVSAYDTTLRPGFARVIHAGGGGVEFDNRTLVAGRDKSTGLRVPVDVYSNNFIRGVHNGSDGNCSSPAATTRIDGNAYAAGNIEKLGSGTGPCIDGDAYSGGVLSECRILGTAITTSPVSMINCPHTTTCNPDEDPHICEHPVIEPLPDIGVHLIKQFLESNGDSYSGNCVIGGASDCSTLIDGRRTIGNIIIDGNLTSSSDFYVSGPIWVKGDVLINSNQIIRLDPSMSDSSLIILASGKIRSSSNVTFTSESSSFLLFASEYENNKPDVCQEKDDAAIRISANVNSILFYAINGCALVENPTASSEFYGAILGEGIKTNTNTRLIYDPDLQNAEFFLRRQGGWQISSFTQK